MEKLNVAAKAFIDTHGPMVVEEFGVQLQRSYKFQAETTEHDLAARKVDGAESSV